MPDKPAAKALLPERSLQVRQSFPASVRCALAGLAYLVRQERNARIHLAATVLVILAAVAFRLPVHDLRWLIVAIALVWIAEALNTAVERLCDIVSTEWSEPMGRVKDISSGAVLVASIAAALIGATIFWPHMAALHR